MIEPLASRQAGNISYEQLLEIGFGRNAIHYRVRTGRLLRIHVGVFRAGHLAPARLAEEFAAFLACGEGSLVAASSSLCAWSLPVPKPSRVQVIVPKRRRASPDRIAARVGTVPRAFRSRCEGLPVTTPALAILDCATDLSSAQLDHVISVARRRGLVRPTHFAALRRWQPRRRGWRKLAGWLDQRGGLEASRSLAESRAYELLAEADLGEVRRNVRVEGLEVDFWLPRQQVAVEVDGFDFHGGESTFNLDRERDARLRSQGIEVWRLSPAQLTNHRSRTLAELRSWSAKRRGG